MWLPPGSPLWVSVGGPMAWPADVRALNEIEFRLRVLDWRQTKGTQPKPKPEPPYAHERASEAAVHQRKAAAHMRRQAMKR